MSQSCKKCGLHRRKARYIGDSSREFASDQEGQQSIYSTPCVTMGFDFAPSQQSICHAPAANRGHELQSKRGGGNH
eukprot:3685981-Prymnesium_polylepis.1